MVTWLTKTTRNMIFKGVGFKSQNACDQMISMWVVIKTGMTSHYIGCSKGILIVVHYDRYNPCVTGWYGPLGAAAIQGLGHCSIANLKNARVHYSSVFFWLSNKHENPQQKNQRKNLCFEFWIVYISSFLPFRPELHMVCMLLHSRNPDWAWENNRCRHLHCPPHPQNSVVFEWLYQWSCWPCLKIAEVSLWLKSSHMQCPRSYDMNEQSLSKHERHIVLHLVDSLFST